MKELSVEQKAKRYDEAIKRAKNHHDNDGLTLEQYETIDIIFPELKEKKELRKIEQNPAWSEEDEAMINNLYRVIDEQIVISGDTRRMFWSWLKSLKDRVQPKQEWSGGDEAHLHSLITHLEQWIERHPNTTGADIQGENIAWLKSLRPQSQWKPSDEQIKVCKEVYADILSAKGFDLGTVNSELNRMEEQLKKLKE